MPGRIYISPPPSPVRRMPRSVTMNEVLPSPWGCVKCRKVAKTYADGVVFCENCQCRLQDADKVDISRGPQRNTISPSWKRIQVD